MHTVAHGHPSPPEEFRGERHGAADREVGPGREVLRGLPAQVRPHERQPHRVRCGTPTRVSDFKLVLRGWPAGSAGQSVDRGGDRGCACLTDEVDDEAAIREAAGGAAEEGLPVWRPERGLAGVVAVEEGEVARVRQRVPEAEHPRDTRSRLNDRGRQQQERRHRGRQEEASSSPGGRGSHVSFFCWRRRVRRVRVFCLL